MTLGVSNVSWIHFGFKFIVHPDPDPITEYALSMPWVVTFTRDWTADANLCKLRFQLRVEGQT